MTNSSLIGWKIIEYWRGSFYLIDDKNQITKDWLKLRDESILRIRSLATEYLERNQYKLLRNGDGIKIVQPKDDENNFIKDENNWPRKYLQFPLFWLELDTFKCKAGIRINICGNPNLSKIFIYLIAESQKKDFDNVDLENFANLAKKHAKKLNTDIYKIYNQVILDLTQYKLKSTSYCLEMYNLGSTSKHVMELAGNDNIERMRQILTHPEAKHAYYTMLSLAGKNFEAKKSLTQLKSELMKLPSQALIPTYRACDEFYSKSLFAQSNVKMKSKSIMLAGITAIELDSINKVDWDKITAGKNKPQTPFCRVKSDFTPIEAWHHSTSSKIVLPFACL